MTTLQTLEMALEAFEIAAEGGGVNFYEYAKQLRQQIALEKKAENERELGIQMQPVKMVAYNCKCGRTMKFESEHGVIAPKREWVGLTDAEIYSEGGKHEKFAKNGNEWFDRGSFARAIEAAHGIKEKNT